MVDGRRKTDGRATLKSGDDLTLGASGFGGSGLSVSTGAESCDITVHCHICTIAVESSFVKATEICHFCCGQQVFFENSPIMCYILD